jgi:DNA-directed RNA polymerase II subunit RPB2
VHTQWKDISTRARHDEGGIVTFSQVYDMPHGKRAHVDVRTTRPTIVGDKFTTSYAQKGVVGAIWADVDLPFSMTTGIIPDIIVSPLSLTSRMTMSSLIEALTGKVVCVTGERSLGIDAQNYTDGNTTHIQEMERILATHGFAADGTEAFVDGRTGRPIQTRLFVGCVDMFRLVHLASKKIHARSTGPRDPLTRQPKDGRKFGGGLRIGEMESNALVAHGATRVLQERFRELSDGFDVHICTSCGIMVDDASLEIGYSYCTRCQSTSSTKIIRIPFTFHVMLLELLSAGVSVRFGISTDPVSK